MHTKSTNSLSLGIKLLFLSIFMTGFGQCLLAQSNLCASSATTFCCEYVSSVSINGVVKNTANTSYSSGPGYQDFSGTSITNLVAGSTYPVSVTVQAASTYLEYVKIWMDFNGNGNLQDAGELVMDQNATFVGTYVYNGNITVPTTAYNGPIYMRVIMVYSNVPQLCGSYTYGNTLDFKATISGGLVSRKLTVATAGSTGGSVVSSPSGINTAQGINSANFADGSTVTLTSSNGATAFFTNWSGAASGTASSVAVPMNADKSITANFASLPTVTTSAVSSISYTTAVSGGTVSSDGGQPVTARGICWNTTGTPTTANAKTSDGSGTGSYSSALTGLAANTTYYVRSYAINSAGISYGSQVSFTTAAYAAAGALNFGGGSEYVKVANSGINFTSTSFTIEAWAKRNAEGAYAMIFSQGGLEQVNKTIHFGFRDNGNFTFAFYGNDLDAIAVSDLNWHHWAATYNATTKVRRIYRDGVLMAQDVSAGGYIGSGNTDYIIGQVAYFNGMGSTFNGNVDELRIWTRELCQNEIQNNFNGQLPAGQTGLAAYYQFNQGLVDASNPSVTSLTDASGNNRTGTLMNFALTGQSSNWVTGKVIGTAPAYVAPTATITAGSATSFCQGGNVVLTATTGATYQWYKDGSAINGAVAQTYTANAGGTYYAVVANSGGCVATSNSIAVTVNAYPQVTATAASTTLCNGSSTILSASGASTYSWSNGQAGSSISVSAAGNYSVTGTSNGCSTTSNIVSLSTGTQPTVGGIDVYQQAFTDATSCSSMVTYPLSIGGTPAPTVSYSFSGATTGSGSGNGSGQVYNKGITHVTVTATNGCGSGSNTFDIKVVDNVKPVARCKPLTVTLDASGHASITAAQIDNGSSDNCGPVTTSISREGTICGIATENNTITLQAPAGTLIDRIDFASYGTPTGNCGSFSYGWCHSSISQSKVEGLALGRNSASIPATNSVFGDPCGGTVKNLRIQAHYSAAGNAGTFDCGNIGNNEVILMVTDADGNVSSCTSTVTVVDNSAPVPTVATLPALNGECSVTAVAPTATDNCAGMVIATTSDPRTYSTQGAYTIHWNYSDGHGNNTQQTQQVLVKDLTAPVPQVTTLPTITAECAAALTAPKANDNCAGIVTATTVNPTSYSAQGTYTVNWTYNDGNGNSSTQQQTVIIKDVTAPVFNTSVSNVPANILSRVPEASQYSLVYAYDLPTSAAYSNTTAVPTTANNAAALASTPFTRVAYFMELDNKWVWVSMDKFTNTVSQTGIPSVGSTFFQQKVTNMNVVASSNAGVTAGTGIATGNIEFWNNCYTTGNTLGLAGANGGTYDYDDQRTVTSPSCYGSFQVHNWGAQQTLFAYNRWASGGISDLGIGNNTGNSGHPDYTFQQNAGQYASRKLYVFIAGGVNANLTANASATSCDASVAVSAPTASDNCSNAVVTGVRSDNQPLNATYPKGVTTITWTATDAVGNQSTQAQTVTVTDNVAPVANVATLPVLNGQCSVTATAPTATDNCSGIVTATTADPLTYTVQGTYVIHWAYTDGSGNQTVQTQQVIVKDNTAPVPNVANLATVKGECSVSVPAPTATDNCSGQLTATTVDPTSYTAQGSYTIHWVYTDASGNTAQQDQTVIVKDVTPPVIACAFNVTVNAAPNSCGATVSYNAPSATDNCGNGALPTSLDGYTYKGTYGGHTYFISNSPTTPEDAHARAIALGGHLVTISDAQENAFVSAMSPNFIWIGHTDREVEGTFKWVTSEPVTYTNWNSGEPNNAGGNEDWAVINWGPNGTWNDWYYTENALFVVEFEGGNIPTHRVSGLGSGATFPIGTTTETWEAVDAGGNRATCSFTVTVVDTQAPTIVGLPANITVGNDAGVCGARVTWTAPTSADNCSGHSITQIAGPASGSVFPIGSTVVRYRAQDASGLTAISAFIVTVKDTEKPSIVNLPSDITVGNDPAVCGARVSWTQPTSSDNCSGHSVTQIAGLASGSLFPTGSTIITYRAVDAKGNSDIRSFTVTVNDTEAPVLAGVPANSTVECNAVPDAATVTATDNCAFSGLVRFSESRVDGNCPSSYTLTRTWSSTDAAGNTASATQVITVQDTQAPELTVSDVSVNNDATNCGAVVTFAASASDNCSTPAISYSQDPGTYFPVGTTTVTATAKDACGNTTSKTFTVTVADNELPVVHTNSFTIQLDATGAASITAAQVDNGSTDNCGIASISADKMSFDCSNTGANTVTLAVTDVHGNVNTATAIITVEDHVAPVISCPASVTLNCQDDNSTANTGVATAMDACGIASITHADVSTQSADINNAAHYNYTIARTWTALDNHGNSSQCLQTITVQDISAPVLTCPGNRTVACDGDVSTQANGNATAKDNCGPVSIAYSDASTQASDINSAAHYNYSISRTWTATDVSGNSSQCVQIISVQDVTAPVISTVAASLDRTVECSDAQGIAAALVPEPSATDNCAPVTRHLVSDVTSNSCGTTYTRVRTWNFTDPTGNTSASFTQTIKVVDRTAPVVTFNAGSVEHCFDTTSNLYPVPALAATDNCTAVRYAYTVKNAAGNTLRTGNTANASGTFAVGVNTIYWTVTDACGNSSNATTSVRLNAPITGAFNSFTVLPNATKPNTLYLGYTPASSTALQVTAGGGTPGYTYQWSKQGTAASFTVSSDPSKITMTAAEQGTVTFIVVVTDSKGCKAIFRTSIDVVDVRCGNKLDKVLVCHNTGSGSNPWVQVCVAPAAVATQLGNGGYLGACTSNAVTRQLPKVQPTLVPALSAYPNPSRGIVQLRVSGLQGKLRVEVLDSRGSRVLQHDQTVTYQSEDLTLNLQTAAAGLYTVRVSNGDTVLTTRIVIAR
ncbi:HYR domain-containing protein [Flaviaesturariibacter terrae]